MENLSEVFQEKFNIKKCPFLRTCNIVTTYIFFKRLCKNTNYLNCNHFAELMGELKTPFSWVQKQAVDNATLH